MEKATKNTHLNHLEDNIFLNGIEGTRDSINFIQGLRDTLQGNNSRAMNTSVKWDGAPAIWIGPHPTNGHLMVAKKSLFNKVPLYYQSVADIKNSTDLSKELKKKFILAFEMYKDVKLDTLIQGDFLFDQSDLSTQTIDGEKFLVFQPNTIAYTIPADSDLAKIVSKKKMGIVFHTSYSGSSIPTLSARAGVRLPKAPEGVWQLDADYEMSTLLTKSDVKKIDDELSNVGRHFRLVSRTTFEVMNEPHIAALATTYTNAFIRNNVTPTAEDAAVGFPKFIEEKYGREMLKRKTAAGKDRQKAIMQAALMPVTKIPKHEMVSLFHLYYSLQKAKDIMIKMLSRASFIKTWLKTYDGWRATGQEGFVASDKTGTNSVKLVDRLEFSYANFSDDVIKGWQSDFRR